ncbi:MAG: DUF3810 domain-containing protein [Ruminococcaceae bacterium]|nr:DUF3810 domain-containing protein [Oscillospiraceae bacterium]
MKNHSHTMNSIRVILLCPISLVVAYFMSLNPSWAEWYALNVYPIISKSINSLSSSVDFSVAEIVVIVFFGLIILYTLYTVVKLIFGDNRFHRLFDYILNIASIASIVCFVFVFFCGINYHRLTFTEVAGFELKESSTNELYELCLSLTDEVNSLRGEIPENPDGVSYSSLSTDELAEKCRKAYDTLESEYPTLISGYSDTKPVHFSDIMSYSGITGVFFPFTYEANVNVAAPEYSIPATMCHELTHLRGYMREDEANFIAYLACKNSEEPFIRYSGYMLALTHSLNRLYGDSSEKYYTVYDKLSEDVKTDLRFSNSYWASHEGIIEDISDKVNDVYLKVNQQEDGVKSYGRMVDLLLAEYKKSVSVE